MLCINDPIKHLGVSCLFFADNLVIWTTDKYPILSKLNRTLLNISVFQQMLEAKSERSKDTVYNFFLEMTREFLISKLMATFWRQKSPVYLGVTLDT